MNLLIIVTSFVVGTSLAADQPVLYVCNPMTTIDPPIPKDATESPTYVFPSRWNVSTDPLPYASGQACSWIVNIPAGKYAYVYINSNLTGSGRVQLTDSLSNVEIINGVGDSRSYYYIWPSFRLDLTTGNTIGQMSFRIIWLPFKSAGAPTSITIGRSTDVSLITDIDTFSPLTINAETQVSIVPVPSPIIDFIPYMRACMVFDGPSWNSTFLGNLYTVLSSKKQLFSSGKSMTIFSVQRLNSGFRLIAQDYYNTKNIKEYQGIEFLNPVGGAVKISMNGQGGAAAVVTIRGGGAEYLKTADLSSDNAILQVSYGGVAGQAMSSYRKNTTATHLPQEFMGVIRTYYLSSGTATIQLTRTGFDANWEQPFVGRKGFMSSRNYGSMSSTQSSYDILAGSSNGKQRDRFKFVYNVIDTNFPGNSTLVISTTDDKSSNNYEQKFTSSSIPSVGSEFSASGNTFSVNYDNYNYNGTGFYVEFSVEASSATGLSVLATTVMLAVAAVLRL